MPLALLPGRSLDETSPPSWLPAVRRLMSACPDAPWGGARHPVFVTSSNFGVGNLFAYRRFGNRSHLEYGTPDACVAFIAGELGWGGNVTILSHACVSANVGLTLAARQIAAGIADEALVFTFDFLSPFVAGGFHALKILNSESPAPYQVRDVSAIGLGDGAAFAVLRKPSRGWMIAGQTMHNEMHHFTAFPSGGGGFAACIDPLVRLASGRRLWIKGHGTGTLEAGRLEAEAFRRACPASPLVGWKGSLGHTLGSNGLVELAVALESLGSGRIPGTVGSAAPTFSEMVSLDPIFDSTYDGVICASNAFGGAHAALLLCHA
ncbi:MAG: beta-ketoacyl synthase N-terminal-like domain-containing protein [Opitutaceae bacterium]